MKVNMIEAQEIKPSMLLKIFTFEGDYDVAKVLDVTVEEAIVTVRIVSTEGEEIVYIAPDLLVNEVKMGPVARRLRGL